MCRITVDIPGTKMALRCLQAQAPLRWAAEGREHAAEPCTAYAAKLMSLHLLQLAMMDCLYQDSHADLKLVRPTSL
jgi:hypothetical protein